MISYRRTFAVLSLVLFASSAWSADVRISARSTLGSLSVDWQGDEWAAWEFDDDI